jgi:hypothetical protein
VIEEEARALRGLFRTKIKSFARPFAASGINGVYGAEARCRSAMQPAATTPTQNVRFTSIRDVASAQIASWEVGVSL